MRLIVLRKALEDIMAIIQSRFSPLFDSHRIAICLCSRLQTFIDYIIIPSVSIHHHVNRSGNSILPPRFDIIKVSNGWHHEITNKEGYSICKQSLGVCVKQSDYAMCLPLI